MITQRMHLRRNGRNLTESEMRGVVLDLDSLVISGEGVGGRNSYLKIRTNDPQAVMQRVIGMGYGIVNQRISDDTKYRSEGGGESKMGDFYKGYMVGTAVALGILGVASIPKERELDFYRNAPQVVSATRDVCEDRGVEGLVVEVPRYKAESDRVYLFPDEEGTYRTLEKMKQRAIDNVVEEYTEKARQLEAGE